MAVYRGGRVYRLHLEAQWLIIGLTFAYDKAPSEGRKLRIAYLIRQATRREQRRRYT